MAPKDDFSASPQGTNGQFHPDWEETYQRGFSQNWPWDSVVSFVFRNAPRNRPRREVRILELGFGTGANLWFAAKEGFEVAGIEGSATAVAKARERFATEGLEADLRVGDFTAPLPFPDQSFDLVIDRAAFTYIGIREVRRVLDEVQRVLKPGGYMLFSPYASEHPATLEAVSIGNGLYDQITRIGYSGMGPTSFWTEADVRDSFKAGWALKSLSHVNKIDHLGQDGAHAAWYAVAQRCDP